MSSSVDPMLMVGKTVSIVNQDQACVGELVEYFCRVRLDTHGHIYKERQAKVRVTVPDGDMLSCSDVVFTSLNSEPEFFIQLENPSS